MTDDKIKAKDNALPMKREFSAGGAVYQKFGEEVKWLLGKHSGYHKWVLPKGMIEKGETSKETAVRETEEEMGVVAKIVGDKPIHKEEYWFVATLDQKKEKQKEGQPVRRVKVYQENPEFESENEEKVRVFKTVSFYLMEYVSGDPEKHDWEMEDAGWFGVEEPVELMAFEGERKAIEIASKIVAESRLVQSRA